MFIVDDYQFYTHRELRPWLSRSSSFSSWTFNHFWNIGSYRTFCTLPWYEAHIFGSSLVSESWKTSTFKPLLLETLSTSRELDSSLFGPHESVWASTLRGKWTSRQGYFGLHSRTSSMWWVRIMMSVCLFYLTNYEKTWYVSIVITVHTKITHIFFFYSPIFSNSLHASASVFFSLW